jgi:dynein light chain LC8-type
MSNRGGLHVKASDMDEHSQMKTAAKAVTKEALDALGAKDDKVISGYIKRKMDEKYGPTWHCVVGDDFKAAISHESKHFIFITSGKSNVLLWRL